MQDGAMGVIVDSEDYISIHYKKVDSGDYIMMNYEALR